MASESNSTSGGLGFAGMLTILFIGLKVTGIIQWPWVWVLAPFWIPLAILTIIVLVAVIFHVVLDR